MITRKKAVITGAILAGFATLSFCLPEILGPTASAAAVPEQIPVELVLLVDTSGSVDANEYLLQKQGYVDAFRDSDISQLIADGGGIVVTYIEWSNADHQSIRIPWTRLDTVGDCGAFSDAIADLARETDGETMLAPALEFAMNEIRTNSYSSFRRVIDVSGDGHCENYGYYVLGEPVDGITDPAYYGTPWNDVVAALDGQVELVNGICIGTDTDLIDFYTNILPQGQGSFVMQVDSFPGFAEGILSKLEREIGGVPGMFD